MLKSSGEKPETDPLSQLSYISGLGSSAIQHTMRIQITDLLTDSILRLEHYGDQIKNISTVKCDPIMIQKHDYL